MGVGLLSLPPEGVLPLALDDFDNFLQIRHSDDRQCVLAEGRRKSYHACVTLNSERREAAVVQRPITKEGPRMTMSSELRQMIDVHN